MRYAKFGSAGMKVSQLCLGTNMMGGYVDERTSAELIRTFLECGGNFIDTADVYAQGASELAIGKALKEHRHEAVVATKAYLPMGEGPNDRGTSRLHLITAAENSLRRLQTDYIDVYILHYWDDDTPIEESLRAMDDLVRQGKVRYVGVSNFAAWQVVRSLWTSEKLGLERPQSVQVQYNFLERGPEEELLPLCLDQGLILTPYWVLLAGMFTGKYDRNLAPPEGSRVDKRPQSIDRYFTDRNFDAAEQIKTIATKSGLTPTEVTLAWVLSKPAVGSVIAGTSRPEQVRANCRAVDVCLSDDALRALDTIGT